ncbi:prepilin-type N-terminal cleavage/methylation domain-containing protein [Candidatus Dependentiae bacterium]|nr:prepilin-type N-terminal cleavage/methylation domain-containing protein [Candidatus Dependentiae bacterium]
MKNRKILGFTLIELMIVIAVVAFLSMISIPNFMKFLAKSKRTEALMNLRSLVIAEKSYWAEHGKYTNVLSGNNGLGWKPSGNNYYTYGFAGAEGQNYFSGSLKASGGELRNTRADASGFIAAAAGDIDGDGKTDIITIDQDNKITILQDDLAD